MGEGLLSMQSGLADASSGLQHLFGLVPEEA
jgi:hypothetical protein